MHFHAGSTGQRSLHAAIASRRSTFSVEHATRFTVKIPLSPAQNNQTFQMPRVFRIVYPASTFAGQEEQVTGRILMGMGDNQVRVAQFQ